MSESKLMEKARSLTKEKDPRKAWSKLKVWAHSENNPFAMKAAVFQFLENYGTKPEAVSLLPEVLHNASRLPLKKEERGNLMDLTDRAFKALEMNLMLDMQLPVAENRPAPLLTFNPMKEKKADIYAPLNPSPAVSQLMMARDTLNSVNEAMLRTTGGTPVLSADKGHKLIKSLVEKMKTQGKEEHPHYYIKTMRVEHEAPRKRKTKEKPAKKKTAPKKKPAKAKAAKKKKPPKKKPVKKKKPPRRKIAKKKAAKKKKPPKKKPVKKKKPPRRKIAKKKAAKKKKKAVKRKKPSKRKRKR